jgi:hypothetical protein
MKVIPLPCRARCPRCHSGFIIVEGTFDAESTCLNCGHHPPSLTPVSGWLAELGADAALAEAGRRGPTGDPGRKVA